MKKLTLALLAHIYLSASDTTTALPKPTILAESWDTLWHQRLNEAHELQNNGRFTEAAEAYKNLANNRQHRNETVSSIAQKEYLRLLESNEYVEQKNQEFQKHSTKAQQLMDQLQQAKALNTQGNYTQAKTILTQLAQAPAPHFWMYGFARNELQAMVDARLIESL